MFLEKVFFPFILPALVAIIVGGGIGFLVAFFGEKKNDDIDGAANDILKLLPGLNCGGCGYGGCSAFADSLASGKASPSQCGPCSRQNRELILKICGAETDKKDEQSFADNAAEAESPVKNVAYLLADACIGCGICKKKCPVAAIEVADKKAVISKEKCIGCGVCAAACPKNCIEIKES